MSIYCMERFNLGQTSLVKTVAKSCLGLSASAPEKLSQNCAAFLR